MKHLAPRLWISGSFFLLALGGSVAAGQAQIFDLPRTQFWSQDAFLLFPGAEVADAFGYSLAAGDFDCDGFSDLAIGVPFENVQVQLPPDPPVDRFQAGMVHVLFGSPSGLGSFGAQHFDEGDLFGGVVEDSDRFGEVLTTGDFDGDGCDDLAIGVPEENVGSEANAGAVYEIPGSPGGLDTDGSALWHQDTTGVGGAGEANDRFGSSLAVGNFNGDAYDELVIGAPAERLDDGPFEGAVWVLEGGPSGLQPDDVDWLQVITQDHPAVADDGEPGDEFGAALASCDVDDDGFDELVIGVPGESGTTTNDAGAIHVLYGSAAGITEEDPDDIFLPGFPSGSQRGTTLATGRVQTLYDCTIADGQPLADLPSSSGTVIDGGKIGLLSRLPNGIWGLTGFTQEQIPVSYSTSGFEASEQADEFGSVLAYGDFDGNGYDDLAIGVPREDLAVSESEHGLLQIVPGQGAATPDAGTAFTFRQSDLPAPPGTIEEGNSFGWALAVGDFDGNGYDDLAVSSPFDDLGSVANAGSVQVLYSAAIFSDSFESGDTAAWSSQF